MTAHTSAFHTVPGTARGHFLLHVYAAIYRLIHYMRYLGSMSGEDLEQTFHTYPFLRKYLTDVLQYMPSEITWEAAEHWWESAILEWEQACPVSLPLQTLQVPFQSRIALILAGLVEEDSRFGTLFAKLQEPLAYRRPCLELIGQMAIDDTSPAGTDAWHICQSLLAAGLMDVANQEAPRSEWVLRVPTMLWDVIRGERAEQPAPWCLLHTVEAFPALADLILPPPFRERVAQLPTLVSSGKARALVLRGMQGGDRLQVLGAIARALGQGVIEVDLSTKSTGEPETSASRQWAHLSALCTMTRSLPAFIYELGPGETIELPVLTGYKGPIGILMGMEGGLRGTIMEKAITLNIPVPKMAQRMQYWQDALGSHHTEALTEISTRFHLPGGHIRQAASMAIAHAALDRRDTVQIDDVREACRALNRQFLDTLAVRLEVDGSWSNLVVSEATMIKLRELERRCRYRESLLDHLGVAFGSGVNRGVRALFTGSSGTGKTLAAKILSAVLGMDLYRVDLAAVVNKYIGETEKNLHRVFSVAEELDVILLLDEGDALLGNRTEVKSANDRYANLETNYLLQRLETYQGIALVTTNAGENIDTAFQRRMDVVVNFILPQAHERWHIWHLHLPEHHMVPPDYLEEVVSRCALTGGQIRNAALHATLLALDDGAFGVNGQHLETAIQSEYRKAGAICPLSINGQARVSENDGGMGAFLDALRG